MKKKLNLVTIPYGALPCSLQTFMINEISASEDEFGERISQSDGNYGCADSHFEANRIPSKKVLKKYNITEKQYDEICDELEDVLLVGSCGWCV